jgi:ankyrin repeat protein
MLADRNVDPNAKSKTGGETPLHVAASHDAREAAAALLQYGASLDVRDSDMQTPLMSAAQAGSGAVIELLLGRKADTDLVDLEGRTALSWAATKGDWPKIIQQLLDKGADPNVADRAGNTALDRAKVLGHRKTANILSSVSNRRRGRANS